jgi:hypothetical protein
MSTAPTSNGNTPEAHERTKTEGRDARGRFVKGNAGGPGNPFAKQTARLRQVMLETITEADLRQVVFTLLLLAKTGNLPAIKLVLEYGIGKPAPMSEPDEADLEDEPAEEESPEQEEQRFESGVEELARTLKRFMRPEMIESLPEGLRLRVQAEPPTPETSAAPPQAEKVEEAPRPVPGKPERSPAPSGNGGNGARRGERPSPAGKDTPHPGVEARRTKDEGRKEHTPRPGPPSHKGGGDDGGRRDVPARGEGEAKPRVDAVTNGGNGHRPRRKKDRR